jgi:hypothetical protein
VEIRGFCGQEEFRELENEVTATGRGLVFMDIKRGEWPPLFEEDFREWRNTDFLIALHEPDKRDLGDQLARKIEATHQVSMIESRGRSLDCVESRLWRFILGLHSEWVNRLNEGRSHQMRWLFAKSHS